MTELAADERRALRARAHKLKPVVLIGDAGLTEAVLAEIDRCLDDHELIKIKAGGEERAEREALSATVCERLGAAPVQHIGKILVLYRKAPEKPQPPAVPEAPRRRTAARRQPPRQRPASQTRAKPRRLSRR
ncbi:MAG TPA: YhbY family RNA-binding protein [Pelomicrobium sp.]|nr:YhbY family RNA-binding protein [Pelomicrobium sp.]